MSKVKRTFEHPDVETELPKWWRFGATFTHNGSICVVLGSHKWTDTEPCGTIKINDEVVQRFNQAVFHGREHVFSFTYKDSVHLSSVEHHCALEAIMPSDFFAACVPA